MPHVPEPDRLARAQGAFSVSDASALLALMGPQGAQIGRCFDLIEITEEEVKRAGSPEGMFMVLVPPAGMSELSSEVYRSHARELLKRHAAGEPLDLATDAELLCAFSEGSLRAPLNATGWAAYVALARRVFTSKEFRGQVAALSRGVHEPYEGAVEEILSDMRQRLRVPGRGADVPPVAAPVRARSRSKR